MTIHKSILIQHPLHIPAVIETSKQLSLNSNQDWYLLLNHQEEPCIIRGRGQVFSGRFHDSYGHHIINNTIPEIKRQDGGNTWYHGDTICFLKISPYNNRTRFSHESFMYKWQEEIKKLYETFSGEELLNTKGSPDLYKNTTQRTQIFGTSAWNNSIARACWYEEESTNRSSLEYLVSMDPQGDFNESLDFAKEGFKEYLQDHFSISQEIPSSQFITLQSYDYALLLQKKQGSLYGSCIGGEYPQYRRDLKK